MTHLRALTRLLLAFPVLAFLLVAGCSALSQPTETGPVTFACGQLDIRVDEAGDGVLGISYPGGRWLFRPAVSASGARYEAPGDPDTQFWRKGDRALLVVNGDRLPECLPPGALERPFQGGGNEPFWHLTLDDNGLSLKRPLSPAPAEPLAVVSRQQDRFGQRVVAGPVDDRVTVTVARQLCRDDMSGQVFPAQVRLSVGGADYRGCGGEPDRLLRGVEWRLVRLGDETLPERPALTLRFASDRRLSGQSACNRIAGGYRLTGEGLTLSNLASTRMACDADRMALEARYLALLGKVARFDLDPQNRLQLITSDGTVLLAEPEPGR